MRKFLARLLLVLLPLTPSWAGVAVDCSSGSALAAAAAQAAGSGEAAATPDCCGGEESHELQCGSDCTNCHGLGLTALTGLPPAVGHVETASGDSTHACRIAAPVTSEPLRPPSGPAA